jgi:2'-5' RNA ligase
MRAFIAIDLSAEIKDKIAELENRLQKEDLFIAKWVFFQDAHLTLKFLGDITDKQAVEIGKILAEICQKHKVIDTKFKGLGSFPSQEFVKVLWIGVTDGDIEIKALQKEIESNLSHIGFKNEKDYVNHITIARVSNIKDKNRLKPVFEQYKDFELDGFKAKKIKLMKSTLNKQGPIYETIQEFSLL